MNAEYAHAAATTRDTIAAHREAALRALDDRLAAARRRGAGLEAMRRALAEAAVVLERLEPRRR